MDLQSLVTGVGTQLSTDYALDVVLFLAIVALARTLFLSRRITLLTRGEGGASLEKIISTLSSRVETLEAHAQKSELAYNNLDERLQTSLRGVAVERFDPFQNAGGQQSFTTALLNESGDGVVISGIHARDGVRVYAKEVQKFASERELSDEERQTIAKAKKKLE